MRVAIALVAALLAGMASADPQPWMKKASPDELVLWVVKGKDCALSEAKAKETVEGVLIRSRIKPLPVPESGEPSNMPWLFVTVACAEPIFNVKVDFLVEDSGGWRHRAGLAADGSYGTYGTDINFVLNAIREGVESAITDYLKANFDL